MPQQITLQYIADFDYELRERREKLTLWNRPIETGILAVKGVYSILVSLVRDVLLHPVCKFVLLPLIAVYIVSLHVEHPWVALVDDVEFAVEYTVWWVGLGVLSSIGMGSGLQSGMLFMYPHIIKIFIAAQTCKTLNFESETDIWFRKPATLFLCPSHEQPNSSNNGGDAVTYWATWFKILPACFLQATGTVLGEIPPFFMSRQARLASIEAQGTPARGGDGFEIPDELDSVSKYGLVNKGKIFLVRFLRNYGTAGVLFMASIPNPLFDLCGIACGHFLMPFEKFLLATFIGKAIIRNGYQSLVYVAIADERYLDWLVRALQRLVPDRLQLDAKIRTVLEQARSSFHAGSGGSSGSGSGSGGAVGGSGGSRGGELDVDAVMETLMLYWQGVMVIFLAMFVLSCVGALAQHTQLMLDQEESNNLRAQLSEDVRLSCTSPRSGRMHLPVPSQKKKTPKLLSPLKEFSGGLKRD